MVPEVSASIGLNIFIASMMPMVRAGFHRLADADERRLVRRGRAVEGADHRRAQHVAVGKGVAGLGAAAGGRFGGELIGMGALGAGGRGGGIGDWRRW